MTAGARHESMTAVHNCTAALMHSQHTLRMVKGSIVQKKLFALGSSCIGFFLLCGFQSPAAIPATLQKEPDKEIDACLQSTCREVPLRENLSAISVPTKYVRGIVGGFE